VSDEGRKTESAHLHDTGFDSVRRFRLAVVEGADKDLAWSSASDRCSIGTHPSNELKLSDPTVSRFHCELVVDARGVRLRDLGSRNGTDLDGVLAVEAYVRDGSVIRMGRTALRFELERERNKLPISTSDRFGSLLGASPVMRATFALLEQAAVTASTVLLQGETGTGKEGAAEGIHAASPRRDGPFVVVDCSAIPENLLESELFGHERGAFTGANERRIGAFEEASGGTIFLDEIGELPLNLQPKLLRALEQREVRRVGGTGVQKVDVRVVAATNRDLRAEINAGRFRPDLFFRLAVIKVRLPSLRERPDDLQVLVPHIGESLEASPEALAQLCEPSFIAHLQEASWPGNVRELRNYLERCIVFRQSVPLAESHDAQASVTTGPALLARQYPAARRWALAEFERSYVEALLIQHQGKVVQAARAAGINRVHLFRLTRRHGVKV
jgi:DNA-binding NtrC family response regulator